MLLLEEPIILTLTDLGSLGESPAPRQAYPTQDMIGGSHAIFPAQSTMDLTKERY